MQQYNLCGQECAERVLGGIAEIWVAKRTEFGPFNSTAWYYEQTHQLQYAKIIYSRAPKRVCMCNILHSIDDAKFSQVQAITPSRNYTMTLDLFFNEYNIVNRDLIEQFVVDDELVIVFLTNAGVYYLMGETNGCSVNWNFSTEVYKGKFGSSVQFTCIERYPIRIIDDVYLTYYLNCEGFRVSEFLSMAEIPCDTTWEEICSSDTCR